MQHITHNMYIKDYTKQAHIDINDSCDVQQETILVVVHKLTDTDWEWQRHFSKLIDNECCSTPPSMLCYSDLSYEVVYSIYYCSSTSGVEFLSLKHNMSPCKPQKKSSMLIFKMFKKYFSIIHQTKWHTRWKMPKQCFVFLEHYKIISIPSSL